MCDVHFKSLKKGQNNLLKFCGPRTHTKKGENERMKKTSKVAVAILMVLFISIASASVFYYTLTKPGSVTITLNTWMIELYAESPNPTTVVTSIDFGSVMQGSTKESSVMYLYGTQNEGGNPKDYALKWDAQNLPSGASITCYYSWPYGQPFVEWTENTEITAAGLLDVSETALTSFALKFEFDSDLADAGTYTDLIINIEAGDPSA